MPPSTPEQRSIVLGDENIAYELRRSKRRSIGLRIDHRGLCVGAPLRARLGDIESLIREHGRWVLDKLADWRERPPPQRQRIADGSRLNLLGREYTLHLHTAPKASLRFEENALQLAHPPTAEPARVLEKALREHVRQIFLERLAHFAPMLGVPVPPLRLSSARTRWGSCSARGHIALNWRLVFMPPAVLDYVVAHELAHLKEMNHSPRFWAVVEGLCPDWRALRLELRRLGRALPLF